MPRALFGEHDIVSDSRLSRCAWAFMTKSTSYYALPEPGIHASHGCHCCGQDRCTGGHGHAGVVAVDWMEVCAEGGRVEGTGARRR